jgi:NCS1 family nucleobase:cation symporter-1
VPELYTEDRSGAYYYRRGFNPRAIIAMVPAAAVALLIAFVPALGAAAPFAWFFAAGIAAVVYFVIADRSQRLDDVDGEAIAVASTH